MMPKDIYISIDPQSYKQNKANLLSTQMDLLNIMKHLKDLKRIKREKRKLKRELHELFKLLTQDLENLENHLPTPEIPKAIQDKITPPVTKEIEPAKPKTAKSKPAEKVSLTIEQELKEIQDKLRKLNSSR